MNIHGFDRVNSGLRVDFNFLDSGKHHKETHLCEKKQAIIFES